MVPPNAPRRGKTGSAVVVILERAPGVDAPTERCEIEADEADDHGEEHDDCFHDLPTLRCNPFIGSYWLLVYLSPLRVTCQPAYDGYRHVDN